MHSGVDHTDIWANWDPPLGMCSIGHSAMVSYKQKDNMHSKLKYVLLCRKFWKTCNLLSRWLFIQKVLLLPINLRE